jgi:hypothetical protein
MGVSVSRDDSVEDDRDDGDSGDTALLEDGGGDEGIDEGMVVSVIGESLDTRDETIEAVGLNKDVSNEMSGPSPNVTDLIDGEGSNIEES